MSLTAQSLLIRGSTYFDHQHFNLCDQPFQGIMNGHYMIYAFRKLALCMEKLVIFGLELQDNLGVTLSILFRLSQHFHSTLLPEKA
jgi:hypothetical protein